ncbi:MAG TPA: glycosyl hydrolase family 18 protein [Puia sp.]|nr:glycosyl hydrolase family 18 protein [Puia sp.]
MVNVSVMRGLLILVFLCGALSGSKGQAIIGYYSGDARAIDRVPVGQLTHIIFGFCYLRGDRLYATRTDSLVLRKLAGLKKAHPSLKILLSLGGWGGCKTCSQVFSSSEGRERFAHSVLDLTRYFQTDGIDIDWEFPTLGGYRGHPYAASDGSNLIALLRTLRDTLGASKEISFILAGFSPYLRGCVDVVEAAGIVDRIDLMTYDMIGSRSPVTGHHTPLYSTALQQESVDNAVRYLDSLGVPLHKVAVGAAFYGRLFVHVPEVGHGLYQPGRFSRFISMRQIRRHYTLANGYREYWDDSARAPYMYNAARRSFLTYDNERSIAAKAAYVKEKGLNGIFFWELRLDLPRDGLLSVISQSFLKSNGPL